MSLPSTGEDNWGTQLNSYITNVVLAEANAAAASIASHAAASDPHGDRAYALALVQPLTSGVNGPNGFLQLNSSGRVPSSVLPTGGGRTSTFDVVKDYSAPTNGTDASSYIQSALTAAGTAGGGEVWVGDGTFGIGETLYVPSNVWLHLSPGATMNRIIGTNGSAPAYMVANFNGSVSGSGSGNILIEGGQWVFDGQTATGVPMAFVNGSQVIVQNTTVRTLTGKAAILLAGMSGFAAHDILFSTATPTGSRASYASSQPAIRVENAVSSVISGLNAGMYTGSPCAFVTIEDCAITGGTASDGTGLYSAFGGMAGTTSPQSSSYHANILVSHNGAVALPFNAVYPANWQTMTVTSNQFNVNNGATATASWTPSPPAQINQVVTNNGTSDGTASGTFADKSAGTPRSNTTTLTLDSDLNVQVVAGGVYEVRAGIGYSCASSSVGIKWDFQVPSGTFGYPVNSDYPVSGNVTADLYFDTAGTPDSANTFGSGVVAALQINGILKVGATGGTFGFLWAPNNFSATPVTVVALSYLSLSRLA